MKKNVLVVEDDQPMCWLIERILKDDFNVQIKREGVAAMEWLSEGNIPDLILCDFVLPKFNGLDFLQHLHKSGAFNEIPVIIFSSVCDDEFQEKCLAAGAGGFLEKPFDPPQLIDVINEVLKKKLKKTLI
ncbi:MAG: response regulator [Fulvivirga sp.]|nr:response regulator [Fulvivirga sp.]